MAKSKTSKSKVSTIQSIREDINPQLCKVYNPIKHQWDTPWLAEPKFDGLRCIVVLELVKGVNWIESYSRNGKPLWNMSSILEAIGTSAGTNKKSNLVLDGEVYTKDWNLSMSIVKRSVNVHPDQDKLRYHVWDCLTLEEWKAGKSDVSNSIRKERLSFLEHNPIVEIVKGKIVSNPEELQHAYQGFLAQGYEGAILKRLDGIYECGRKSPYWLKIKPWFDADLTIIDGYPGEGKHLGRLGGLVLEGEVIWGDVETHVKTEVGTGFSDEERQTFQELLDTGILKGKIAEIKFQSITTDGACRFPVFHRLREDKE